MPTPRRCARAAAARAEADQAEAEHRAADIRQESRARGAADGAQRVEAQRAATRREARAVVLHAQRQAYERLRSAAVAVVADDLARPAVRQRLHEVVGESLGPDARVEDAAGGGLDGSSADGRRVDASAARLVDLALAGIDLDGLWAP